MPEKMYAIIDEGEILGLLKHRHDEKALPRYHLEISGEYLEKMGYILGLSNEFTNINQISVYMKQADYAVEIGNQMGDKTRIYHFREFILKYILTRFDGTFPAECLYSTGLLSLIEHDKDRNTDYIQTLDVYLRNEMRITATSNELFLHRSSLLNRLDKIRNILDEDLEDPDTRLYLRACLYLMKKRDA